MYNITLHNIPLTSMGTDIPDTSVCAFHEKIPYPAGHTRTRTRIVPYTILETSPKASRQEGLGNNTYIGEHSRREDTVHDK